MTRPRSLSSIAWSASAALLLAAASVLLRGDRARACGWDGPVIGDLTTFDPAVIGDDTWDGLYFDPFDEGYGGSCRWGCPATAMLADWQGYLKQAGLGHAQVEALVLRATAGELTAIADRLAGQPADLPAKLDLKALWSAPKAARTRALAAIAYLRLSRELERFASLAAAKPPPEALLDAARAGMRRHARDPFLGQRYAFLVARALFYRRDWAGVVKFVDRTHELDAPSEDIKWRARHYLAGALVRDGQRGRGNLELARIGASYPPLAGQASQDFKPMEEKDWRASLALARNDRERAMLWRLVGIRYDGLTAIDEIYKLDPRSNLLALLVVRELTRAESRGRGWAPATPADLAARTRDDARLERVTVKIAGTPGADRPWLMDLVAGHLAALRGDLTAARVRLGHALAARPNDPRVANQVHASLALALATHGHPSPDARTELAHTMAEIGSDFGRARPVRDRVRARLAKAYAAAGDPVEAELLSPGAYDASGRTAIPASSPWHRARFIAALLARAKHPKTAFDRMVLEGSYSVAELAHELALRHLLDGDFATAIKLLRAQRGPHPRLGTNPFAARIVDCHDCDHARFANAPWTALSVTEHLAQLARAAHRPGEAGARAALELGNAYYNFTYFGNARALLEGTHQVTRDTHAAERWYARAYHGTKDRERKAEAAYLAAKAELARMLDAVQQGNPYAPLASLPRPSWYREVAKYADTAYYRDVIHECGWYRGWAAQRAP